MIGYTRPHDVFAGFDLAGNLHPALLYLLPLWNVDRVGSFPGGLFPK